MPNQHQSFRVYSLQKQLSESPEEQGSIVNMEAKGLKDRSRSLSERVKEEITDSRHIT